MYGLPTLTRKTFKKSEIGSPAKRLHTSGVDQSTRKCRSTNYHRICSRYVNSYNEELQFPIKEFVQMHHISLRSISFISM